MVPMRQSGSVGEREPVRIAGERVVLRTATHDDVDTVVTIMRCPGVSEAWVDFDVMEFIKELDDPQSHPMIVDLVGGDAGVGYVQFFEEDDAMYRHANIDIALHDQHQNRGIGRDSVRTLARYLFTERGHHRLTIDPALLNGRAIRCYAAVGFKRVGVMREYERGRDGRWHDGLLMDLLAGEFDPD